MASLESMIIAQQATTILSNVRRDLLAETNRLNDRLGNNQWTAAFVASTANGVGTQLRASLQLIADHQAAVEAALLEWEVSVADTTADWGQLRDASEALRDATASNIGSVINGIISQVPSKTRLF